MTDTDENVIGETLTLKQETFCRFYTQKSELFANGTLSYARAYGHDLENASRDDSVYLLKNGRTVTKKELDDLTDNDTRGSKKIQDSSYDRMHANCRSYASRLTTNDNIIRRIEQLMNEQMTSQAMDARLTEIALHGEDKDSLPAIKEFNKLKQRITEKKDITSNGETISGFNFVRAEGQPAHVEGVAIKAPEPTFANDQDNANNTTNS